MRIILCLFIVLLISQSGYPEEGFSVEVKDGLLSVEVSGVEFGKIMEEVSRQTGIEMAISPDIASLRLSTSFKGLEIEGAIKRMLNLIGQKNYTIHFAEGGMIKKIEVSATTTSTPQQSTTPGAFPMRRAIPPTKSERYKNLYTPQGERPTPPPYTPKGTFEPKKESPSEPIAPEPLPPGLSEEEIKSLEEMMDEPLKVENSTDAPYIAPKEKPLYIPPKK